MGGFDGLSKRHVSIRVYGECDTRTPGTIQSSSIIQLVHKSGCKFSFNVRMDIVCMLHMIAGADDTWEGCNSVPAGNTDEHNVWLILKTSSTKKIKDALQLKNHVPLFFPHTVPQPLIINLCQTLSLLHCMLRESLLLIGICIPCLICLPFNAEQSTLERIHVVSTVRRASSCQCPSGKSNTCTTLLARVETNTISNTDYNVDGENMKRLKMRTDFKQGSFGPAQLL